MENKASIIKAIISINLMVFALVALALILSFKTLTGVDEESQAIAKARVTLDTLTSRTNTIADAQDWKQLSMALAQYGSKANLAQKSEIDSARYYLKSSQNVFYISLGCAFFSIVFLTWLVIKSK